MGSAAVGLDFGTTNSAVAFARADEPATLVAFPSRTGPTPTFRSVLHFERGETGEETVRAGPAAIESYLASEERSGRLMQSLKSFLASRLFRATQVFGRPWRLEDLVAVLLRELREEAERQLGEPVQRAVVGRPVRFVHAQDAADEALALGRLRAACTNAGFREVLFEYEPIGAACYYESRLERDELLLIADFGGGTSDFSLVRVGPGFRGTGRREGGILGNAGVPVAGDAFDGKLVRHVVAPRLGRGAEFRSFFGRVLPVPAWLYAHLERWHHLSLLKSPKTLQLLYDLRDEALDTGKLAALLQVVENDLGFLLFRAVEATKRALSEGPEAHFRFVHEELEIEAPVRREDFEGWIAEELAAIAAGVDGLLNRCGVVRREVDRVFLTGGSSFVPAVRRLFEERFGAERLRSGDELVSVATGLALRGREGRVP
jgi:hypothetical chaperone protein